MATDFPNGAAVVAEQERRADDVAEDVAAVNQREVVRRCRYGKRTFSVSKKSRRWSCTPAAPAL